MIKQPEHLIFNYIDKRIEKLDEQGIKAKVIRYEITDTDMMLLASTQTEQYQRRFIFMAKDNVIDMIVDSIDDSRIVTGGVLDNKFIVAQYIVKEGLDKLLMYLSMNNS